jgi:hypothetical protein
MRNLYFVFVALMLASTPVLAQPTAQPTSQAQPQQVPLDKGPYTPEASKAYNGGGMILQGAPGAPAPAPQPTGPAVTATSPAPAK